MLKEKHFNRTLLVQEHLHHLFKILNPGGRIHLGVFNVQIMAEKGLNAVHNTVVEKVGEA